MTMRQVNVRPFNEGHNATHRSHDATLFSRETLVFGFSPNLKEVTPWATSFDIILLLRKSFAQTLALFMHFLGFGVLVCY